MEKVKRKYKVYRRGSIIYVDLGKGVGEEFSFKHFCLVLNNKDNARNGKLTVIPLTSKKKYSEPVTVSLLKHYITTFDKKITKHKKKLTKTEQKLKKLKNNDLKNLIFLSKEVETLEKEVEQYKIFKERINNLINKSTYAKLKDITTISKNRICKYIYGLDIDIRLPKSETDRIVLKCFNNYNWI